jgi:hypothetical protein
MLKICPLGTLFWGWNSGDLKYHLKSVSVVLDVEKAKKAAQKLQKTLPAEDAAKLQLADLAAIFDFYEKKGSLNSNANYAAWNAALTKNSNRFVFGHDQKSIFRGKIASALWKLTAMSTDLKESSCARATITRDNAGNPENCDFGGVFVNCY